MRPSLEKIFRLHYQLSEAQPIIGSRNLYPGKSKLVWDMHYGLEFGLVCSGRMRRFFSGKHTADVKAGEVWFCGMWEPHGMKVTTAPCDVIVLKVWPPFLAQMYFPEVPDFCALAPFNAPSRQRPQIYPGMEKTMIGFARQLKKILASGALHQTLRLRFVLQDMLLYIFENWPAAASWGSRVPSGDFARINLALQLVFESRNLVSTTAAARICGMNYRKFSAMFRSWMNIGVADFSVRHRLYQAAARLRETQEPIKAVARYYGFADASHFHRLLLKHYGVSAAEYRSRARRA